MARYLMFSVCFLAFVACSVFAESEESTENGESWKTRKDMWKKRGQECATELNTDFEQVKHYYRSVFHDDELVERPENFACFLNCTYQAIGIMTPEGEFLVPKRFPERTDMENCLEKTGSANLCETALEGHKCFLTMRKEWRRHHKQHKEQQQ